MIIIGNKNYYNIDISTIIDNFNCTRLNLGLPHNKNGTKVTNQVLNCHLYLNITQKKDLMNIYTNKNREYTIDRNHIKKFLEDINEKKIIAATNMNRGYCLRILKKNNCPIKPSKILFVGTSTVLDYININKFVYVTHFSINLEEKYKNDYVVCKDNHKLVNNGCHNITENRKIIIWAHKNNHIDCTLCLLEDSSKVILNCHKLIKPSCFMVSLLLEKFKEVTIINLENDNPALKETKDMSQEIFSRKGYKFKRENGSIKYTIKMSNKVYLLGRAKNNSGDHLIFLSTKKLLESLNFEIKYSNLLADKLLSDKTINDINSCDYLIISGGPCVCKTIYPHIYPLSKDLNKIKTKIILYGVGLGTKNTNEKLGNNKLLNKAVIFTRDELTKNFLGKNKYNSRLSGCSVLFNGGNIVKKFKDVGDGKILFSVSRNYSNLENKILNILLKLFNPDRIMACFNHGLTSDHKEFINLLKSKSIQVIDNGNNVLSMIKYAKEASFHVGTRVHNHLLSLSLGVKSLLITIDQRGLGQVETFGTGFDIKHTELDKLENNIKKAIENDYSCIIDKITKQYEITKKYLYNI